MLIAVWIALVVSFVAVVGCAAYLVAHAFRAWRRFKALGRSLTRRLGELEASSAAAEAKATKLSASAARLPEALASLEASRAQLAVLLAAAAETRSSFGFARGLMPRK
jgi:hypothetical protein